MIPRIIHFFHNQDFVENIEKYGNMVQRCYATWKHYLPDYELRLWHDKLPEFQTMLKQSQYLQRAYEKKIWAVVADYVRAWVVYQYGGIYLDTDVYLLQDLDFLLENEFFTFAMPVSDKHKKWRYVEPAFMGATPGHAVLKEVLKIYESGEIYRIPMWLANDVFSLAILRAKGDFTDGRLVPLDMQEYRTAQRGAFVCQDIIDNKICTLPDAGITLYPSSMLMEGGAVGKLPSGRWFIISPPPHLMGQTNPNVFCIKDVVAYHICGNSWKSQELRMETKNLKGFARLKAMLTGWLGTLKARVKQKIRTKIKNM